MRTSPFHTQPKPQQFSRPGCCYLDRSPASEACAIFSANDSDGDTKRADLQVLGSREDQQVLLVVVDLQGEDSDIVAIDRHPAFYGGPDIQNDDMVALDQGVRAKLSVGAERRAARFTARERDAGIGEAGDLAVACDGQRERSARFALPFARDADVR